MSRCRCDWFEGADALRPNPVLTDDEKEEVHSFFTPWMIREKDEDNLYDCRCTACREQFPAYRRNIIEKQVGMAYGIVYDAMDEVAEAKHGDVIKCPYCGTQEELIDTGRMGSAAHKMYEDKNFAVFRERDGWLQIFLFNAFVSFSGRDWGAEPRTWDRMYAYAMKPGCVLMWSYDTVCDGKDYRKEWVRRTNASEGNSWYIPIGEDCVLESDLKYSAFDLFDFSPTPYSGYSRSGLIRYLAEYCHRPALEMMMKIELYDVVRDLVRGVPNSTYINWKAKSLPQALRLCKADQRKFCKMERKTLAFLIALQASKDETGKANWKVAEMHTKWGEHTLSRVRNHLHGRNMLYVLNKLERANLSPYSVQLWVDYISMAEELDYDLDSDEVFFPKNLGQKHDEVARNIRAKKNAKLEKTYRAYAETLRAKMGFELNGLRIMIPSGVDDIVQEGKQQHNCVGSYAQRHLRGETIILFLRRSAAPDKSLVTIEADAREPWTLHQVYGHHNDGGKKPEEKAAVVYADWLNVWKAWMQAGSPRDEEGNPIIVNTVEVLA